MEAIHFRDRLSGARNSGSKAEEYERPCEQRVNAERALHGGRRRWWFGWKESVRTGAATSTRPVAGAPAPAVYWAPILVVVFPFPVVFSLRLGMTARRSLRTAQPAHFRSDSRFSSSLLEPYTPFVHASFIVLAALGWTNPTPRLHLLRMLGQRQRPRLVAKTGGLNSTEPATDAGARPALCFVDRSYHCL
jgi:hypothetical protein